MTPPGTGTLAAARQAYEQGEWKQAYELLLEEDSQVPLEAEDLERQGWAARWSGHYQEEFAALERAEKLYTEAGDRRGAARAAIHFGAGMYIQRKEAIAAGCLARAGQLLADESECPEHALLSFLSSMGLMNMGETDRAYELATQALDIAARLGDRDLEALAKLSLGHVCLSRGDIKRGIALHDEASAAAMSGNLGPWASGYIYCSVIVACRNRADWQRAAEWTDRATMWCGEESLQYYPGLCRIHRAEVLRFRGEYDDAEKSLDIARELLLAATPHTVGWAHNEMAEVSLRRGNLAAARESCQRALEFGTEPQPALARLQVADGDIAGALRSIESALESKRLIPSQTHVVLLPVKVTVALAAGETDRAEQALERLEALAHELHTPAPLASAAGARGELELARGRPDTAAEHLRHAWDLWCEIEAPYEAARAQALLARSCAAMEDFGNAQIQMQAARASFVRLGAVRDANLLSEEIAALERRQRDGRSGDLPESLHKTFMFTDIVESTKLVEALGDAAWDALQQWHHRTLRASFSEHGGEEVSCEGDGFFVAFDEARAAIHCALDIQSRLVAHRKEHGFSPHVRIGLHKTAALRRGDSYAGVGIHIAARIGAVGGANEIIASVETIDGCGADIEVSAPRSLELKGISESVEVVALRV